MRARPMKVRKPRTTKPRTEALITPSKKKSLYRKAREDMDKKFSRRKRR